MITKLPINDIITDAGTQQRASIDEAVVAEYADTLRNGGTLPPVVVFVDGAAHVLGDGFHRVHAALAAGRSEIDADVRVGTSRDAILHAVGANATHGLRRTNADKRRAVETVLADPEWSRWSDREIARRTGTTHPFVAKLRAEVVAPVPVTTRLTLDCFRAPLPADGCALRADLYPTGAMNSEGKPYPKEFIGELYVTRTPSGRFYVTYYFIAGRYGTHQFTRSALPPEKVGLAVFRLGDFLPSELDWWQFRFAEAEENRFADPTLWAREGESLVSAIKQGGWLDRAA